MTTCYAQHPDSEHRGVHCMRERGHCGMHVAAPLGRMVVWIEPDKTRGAAKLDSDDLPVTSPSDARNKGDKPRWWQRVRCWFRRGGR